jgi:glycosyltransferase involved in cell wall biosynthesis
MRVGYIQEDYAARRNFLGVVSGLEYVRARDLDPWLGRLPGLAGRTPAFRDFGLNRVDVLHFFNRLSAGRTPWVTTFETVVPRFKPTLSAHHGAAPGYAALAGHARVRRAVEAMAGSACSRLIALSRCNLEMQRELLRAFPERGAAVEAKLVHLPPPQEPLIESVERKPVDYGPPLRFAFVGHAFFRKGGLEMLEAFVELRKGGLDARLAIVSSLSRSDDPAAEEGPEEVRRAEALIAANAEWIEHYRRLSNPEVLDLMRRSHVGLLPTYADTYGYSVLEFQAAGCPVVTTDVRALPEINDDEVGWRIAVPKNRLGEAVYASVEQRRRVSRAIEDGLLDVVARIASDPGGIPGKAAAALERIRACHAPAPHAAALAAIYREARSS